MTQAELTARERLKEIAAKGDPLPTAIQASRIIGVSAERVRQLCSEMGIELRAGYTGPARHRRLQKQPLPPMPQMVLQENQLPPTVVIGTVAELLVTADLTMRGFKVFAPACRTPSGIDLISYDPFSGKTERIEVRSGLRRASHMLWGKRCKFPEFVDRFAIVLPGEPVYYDPPINGQPNATANPEFEEGMAK